MIIILLTNPTVFLHFGTTGRIAPMLVGGMPNGKFTQRRIRQRRMEKGPEWTSI